MTYTISELSARSPDMSDTDFDAFVEDIRTNGQLVPIWVRGSEVIDGRKRLAACQRIGVEPRVVNIDPSQDAEAVARALNVLRTHYSTSQRAMFAADLANATKGESGRRRNLIHQDAGRATTVAEAARETGVNWSSVQMAKKVKRDGSPEVIGAVKAGKLSLHAARHIVAEVPKEQQPDAVDKVVGASTGKRLRVPISKALEGTDNRKDRAMPKRPHEQFARAVQMLDVAAEVITKTAAAAVDDARRKEFLDTLKHVRTTLTRCINSLEIAA